MDDLLIALYHRHVAAAFDRQLRFNDFLQRKAAGADWEYDTETATLNFGKLRFEAPFVGSHAFHNNSWLWGWSNKHLKLTITNRALGDTVRMLVHRLGVHALAAAGFSLEPLLGPELTDDAAHVFGMILSRELGYNAYYLTPYDGGTGVTIIRDKRLDFTERRPLVRIVTIFPQVIDALTVLDHRAAFTSYTQDYGLATSDVPGGVKVIDGKDELVATFDDIGRLTGLSGTVNPEMPKPLKKVAGKKPPIKKKPPSKASKSKARQTGKNSMKAVMKAVKKPVKKPASQAGKKR